MKNNKWLESITVYFVLLIIFYLLIKNAIYAPFTVEDEYNNFYWSNPEQIFGPASNYFETLVLAIKSFIFQGRLLISHLIVIILRAKLFGINPLGHHLTVFLFGLTSAFLIYKIFKKVNFSSVNSFFGALLYISGYAYSEIFFRLSSGECTGNLFLLISIYFIVKYIKENINSSYYWSVFWGIMAGFSKESYIILFPLIFTIPFLFIELHQWKKYIVDNIFKVYIAAGGFILLVVSLIITIKSSGIIFSYGRPLSVTDTAFNNLIWIMKWFVIFIPLVALALWDFIKKKQIKSLLPIFLFAAIWILTQLVIYYKVIISFSQGRYMMPSGLVLIALIVISMQSIKLRSPKMYVISMIILSLLVMRNLKIVYINANEFGARAAAFNKLINKLVDEKPAKIAVYGGVEFFQSINTHFIYKGYHPQFITTPVVYREDFKATYNDSEYKQQLQENLSEQFQLQTLENLKSDTSVHVLITAEPEEYLAINYKEVMKTFKDTERVAEQFSNPGLSAFFKKEFWTGTLKNDQRTYLMFTK